MKISICIPVHDMANRAFFLKRAINSLNHQTFKPYEVIITEKGKMAENTNAAIKKATGEVIKILYMDDYLYEPEALQRIADNFQGGWMATGCLHDDGQRIYSPHLPAWTDVDELRMGVNTIGSPSVVAFENEDPLLFDENLSWLLDCDLYARLYERYGKPRLLNNLDVAIGIGSHQMTHILTMEEKSREAGYLTQKYA